MKITLFALNSSYIHTNLAVRYLAANIDSSRHDVTVLEFCQKDRRGEILSALHATDADVYGFSAYIWNVADLCEIAADLRIIRPTAEIVFGGPEVSYNAEQFLAAHPYVDRVVVGEGEGAWAALADGAVDARVVDGADFTPTLDFRDAGILYDVYPPKVGQMLYYEGSRGCPYRCSYCMSALSGRLRTKDADVVVRELLTLGELNPGGTVKLIDRTFNCDEARAEYIWRRLVENKPNCRCHFEVRAELLTDSAIDILREGADIFLIEAGIQSTNPETLREIKRGGDPELGLQRLRQLMSGVHPPVHGDLIVGLPHENYASVGRSFDTAYPLCDELQLGFLKLLHGSELRNCRENFGIVHSPTPPYEILGSRDITYAEIRRLERIADVVDRLKGGGSFDAALSCLTAVIRPFELFEKLSDALGDVRRLSQRALYEAVFAFGCGDDRVEREALRLALCEDFSKREKGSLPFAIRK